MKKIIFSMFALAALASCSSEDVLDNSGNEKAEIKLNAGVIATKAPIDSDASGMPSEDVANVQFFRTDGTPDWTVATKLTGTIKTDGAINLDGETQYYPTDGTNANILGFYPAATSTTAGVASMTITGEEDVIYAGPQAGNKTTPIGALAFTHKLTQFKFVVKRDASLAADVANVSVTIKDAKTTFDLTLADGTLNNWSTAISTIKPINSATASLTGFEQPTGVMLEPGMSSIVVTVEGQGFNSQDVTITGTDNGTFEAGKAYTLTLTFKATGLDGKATIAKWEDGTSGGADVQ